MRRSTTTAVLLALVALFGLGVAACRSTPTARSADDRSGAPESGSGQSTPADLDDGAVPVTQADTPGHHPGSPDAVPAAGIRPDWLDEGGPPMPASGPSGTRHIDCETGDDDNPGTADQPLRTLAAAGNQPEGTDLVVSGFCENQQLRIAWGGTADDPVIVDGYDAVVRARGAAIGHGAIVEVEGDHVQVWGFTLEGEPSETRSTGRACPGGTDGRYGVGYVVGIRLWGAANTVGHTDISGTYAGVFVTERADGATVTRSHIHDNNILTTGRNGIDGSNDDAGAIGVLLHGSGADVSWNYFRNNRACSPDYFVDGSAVEVFNGSENHIHHNLSVDDHVFTELGRHTDHPASMQGNVYEANRYVSQYGGHDEGDPSGDRFLVTRGTGAFGPVLTTVAVNNKATVLGTDGDAFVCIACADGVLTLGGNELHVTRHPIWYNRDGGGSYRVRAATPAGDASWPALPTSPSTPDDPATDGG